MLKQIADRQRQTAHQRGYTTEWSTYSRLRLQQFPICGMQEDGTISGQYGSRCAAEGRTVPAQCTDHIVPLSRGGEMWSTSNHQSLCLACNTAKANSVDRQPIRMPVRSPQPTGSKPCRHASADVRENASEIQITALRIK